MDSILRGLVGTLVQVWPVRGETKASDTGVLEAYDDHWIVLNRSGEKLCFSVSRIRLIKLL